MQQRAKTKRISEEVGASWPSSQCLLRNTKQAISDSKWLQLQRSIGLDRAEPGLEKHRAQLTVGKDSYRRLVRGDFAAIDKDPLALVPASLRDLVGLLHDIETVLLRPVVLRKTTPQESIEDGLIEYQNTTRF